ncbi:MAG: type II toxin-antitoxin system VapC family toxin [Planctomycetota bacterium]|nr:type II toxin-antitoxin system VapC family toxin [Planctomycetota bacterium]
MKYLIDSDIASYYLRGKHNLAATFERKGLSNLRVSVITLAELQVLAHKNPHSKINLSAIDELGRLLGVLEVDRQTWRAFSIAKAEAERQGRPSGDLDMLQAVVARQHGMILVYHNTKHYEGIADCEDWAK